MTENELFDIWRASPTPENEAHLVSALRKHGFSVGYQSLGYQTMKEIVNDAVAYVLMHPESYKGNSLFSTWFQAVVKYRVFAAYKARKIYEVELEDKHTVQSNPEVNLLAEDVGKLLDSKDLEVYNLLLEGYSPWEMSTELDLPVKLVYKRIDRVRKAVRRVL